MKIAFLPDPNSSPSNAHIHTLRLSLFKVEVRISITRRERVKYAVIKKMLRFGHMGEPDRDRVTSMGETKTCCQ